MTSKTLIRVDLENRLINWNAGAHPLRVENVSGSIPNKQTTWLRATLIPAMNGGGTFCAPGLRGTFQVDVFAAQATGAAEGEILAEAIADLFKAGTVLDNCKIPSHPTVLRGIADPSGHWHIPVLIDYIS